MDSDLLWLIIIFGAWFVLNRFVFPKLGVST